MRLDTVFRYHFPFEYWTLAADTAGNTDYAKTSDFVGMMLPSSIGGLTLITKEQMGIGMQIRNLRDRSGAVVTQVGGEQYPMYIHTAEPQLDPFSNVVAWRHNLRRDPPKDYGSLIASITAGLGQ